MGRIIRIKQETLGWLQQAIKGKNPDSELHYMGGEPGPDGLIAIEFSDRVADKMDVMLKETGGHGGYDLLLKTVCQTILKNQVNNPKKMEGFDTVTKVVDELIFPKGTPIDDIFDAIRQDIPTINIPPDDKLIDQVMASLASPKNWWPGDPTQSRKIATRLRDDLRKARRYYIDDEMISAISFLAHEHPEVIANGIWRARLPFPTIWFEWSPRAHLEAIGQGAKEDTPYQTGVLIRQTDEQGSSSIATMIGVNPPSGSKVRDCCPAPLALVFKTEEPIREGLDTDIAQAVVGDPVDSDPMDSLLIFGREKVFAELAGMDLLSLGLSLCGAAWNTRKEETPDEDRRRRIACIKLSQHCRWDFNPYDPFLKHLLKSGDQRAKEVCKVGLTEFSGTWMTIAAILVLLNGRDYVRYSSPQRQKSSRLVHGKIVPYMEHITVSLKLPRPVIIRRLIRESKEESNRRRHEIEAHWCVQHTQSEKGCDGHGVHDYQPDAWDSDGSVRRRKCSKCGHKVWRRKSHERGDASLGYVIKSRKVTRRG